MPCHAQIADWNKGIGKDNVGDSMLLPAKLSLQRGLRSITPYFHLHDTSRKGNTGKAQVLSLV